MTQKMKKAVADHHMARLIHQHEHEGLDALKVIDGKQMAILVDQRDCVENMVRNLFNLAFLFENGDMRPEVIDKLDGCALLSFYSTYSAEERLSDNNEIARHWLDFTLGFERFGVEYDPLQGNREVLTGLDNVTALITGMLSPLPAGGSSSGAGQTGSGGGGGGGVTQPPSPPPQQTQSSNAEGSSPEFIKRTANIKNVCTLLSSSSMKVVWNRSGPDINNYSDISLRFQYIENGKRHNEKVKLLITSDHVCTRHGDEFSS